MTNSFGLKETTKLKYSEMDSNLSLKPFSLLNFLQDIASKNAEELGFGYTYIHERNLAWFLIKYRMEFVDYPINVNELTIYTEPRGYNKLFAYRNFELYENQRLLGRVSSTWSLVDINSRAIVPVKDVIQSDFMVPFERKESDLAYGKIRPVENPSLTKTFEVRYNDLDVNFHTNNGNYIIWAFEPLDFEFRNSHKIKTLDVVFKKETKYGEKIVSQVEFVDENITIHTLKNEQGDDICLFACEWCKI